MLIRFSARNFKSFGKEDIRLDMVSSPNVEGHDNHILDASGMKILRNAAIYGANAAGKSNVILALLWMKQIVLQGGLSRDTVDGYCKTLTSLKTEETVFDLQVEIEGLVYDYGFACVLSESRITSEWLYELRQDNTAEKLFEYSGNDPQPVLGSRLASVKESSNRFKVYYEDYLLSMRPGKELFLHFLCQKRHYEHGDAVEFLQDLFSWFAAKLDVIGPDQFSKDAQFYCDSNLDDVARVLASFDTGIERLEKQDITEDELRKLYPDVIDQMRDLLEREILPNAPMGAEVITSFVFRSSEDFIGIEESGGGRTITRLQLTHQGADDKFSFGEESDGTKRLIGLLDLLFTKSSNMVYVIDELNRCFHPLITKHFVSLFNEVHSDDCCQMVFTTHENDVMSYDCFRKDEIWFVERGADGYSRMYPLDDFESESSRLDARVGKRYLEGRYGGVPVLSFSNAVDAIKGGNGDSA